MEQDIIEEITSQLTRDTQNLQFQITFPIEEIMQAIIRGEFYQIKDELFSYGKKIVMTQFVAEKDALVTLLAVGILGCILILTSELLQNSQITKIANLVIYLVCAYMTCGLVEKGQKICEEFGQNIGQFMQVLLPTYCLCVNISIPGMVGMPTFLLYQGVLYAMQLAIQYFFVPMICMYLMIVVIGGIGSDDSTKRIRVLLASLIEVTSKISVYMGIGWFTIQEICQVNACKGGSAILLKGVSMIPGIGKMSEQVASMIMTTGSFMKNIIGLFGIVMMIAIVLMPAIRLGILGGGMKLVGAIVAMFGNDKIGGLFDEVGKVLMYYMRFVVCEAAVFCMSILVVVLCLGI